MPEVSIIVPAFRSKDTVVRTLEALSVQSFVDFEVIVIDDGSDDGTLYECNRRAGADGRMRVVPLEHGGVSRARNEGLVRARGRFIAFADADDIPRERWLETLVADCEGVDMSVTGYTVVDELGELLYESGGRSPKAGASFRLKSDEFIVALFSNEYLYQGYVWNKLFRRSLIESGARPLRFAEHVAFNEDRLFVFEYLRRAKAVALSMEPCYTYFAREGDAGFSESLLTEIDAFEEMVNVLKRDGRRSPSLREALFYAEKDMFRAEVLLLDLAVRAGSPCADRLRRDVARLSGYRGEFGNHPPEFQLLIEWALEHAGTT